MSTILGNPKQQWKAAYTQQGDCLIKKVGTTGIFKTNFVEIPKDAKKVKGNLVLKGTTNSHALYGGEFQLFQKDNVLFIRVKKPTVLDHVKDHTSKRRTHAEHYAQWIPVGDYFHTGIFEKDHIKNEKRQVID